MIDKLTSEQEAKIQEYYNNYLAKGLSTTLSNKPVAEKSIKRMYKLINEKEPIIFWVRSITELINLAKDKKSSLDSSLDSSLFWGKHNANWIPFFKYCNEVLGIKYNKYDIEKLDLWVALLEVSYFFTFKGVAILMEHPKEIHLDNNGRNHNLNDFAIKFQDNTGIYVVHGKNVSELNIPQLMQDKKITNLEYLESKSLEREIENNVY